MERKTLIARLRQLQAIDRNALAIYTALSELVEDDAPRKILSGIAKDEKRHVMLNKEIILLLEE